MKKHLLLLASACVGFSALAAEPTVVTDVYFENVSPNGVWAAGADPFTYNFTVYNIPEGKAYTYSEEGEEGVTYQAGGGNFLSNNGVITLDIYGEETAAVWDNGEVITLPRLDTDRTSTANGITPDGTRICGTIGSVEFTADAVTMRFPIIWDRGEDGAWKMYERLPYPELDYTGRVPQYIMAISISDDGKTIAGQVADYSGQEHQPIVWKQNEEGEWSYFFPHPELINPDGLEFPKWVEEGPEQPNPIKYMTPEKAAEYQAALDVYYETWENEPNPAAYMTAEEIEAYNKAVDEFNTWLTNMSDFLDILGEVLANSVIYPRGSVMLSGNGRYYATNHNISDFFAGPIESYPIVFDLETGDVHLMKSDALLAASYINNDGTVLANELLMPMSMAYNAWIAPTLEDGFMPLSEYIQPKYPSVYTWMEENMTHDLETFDPDTWEEVIVPDVWQTGVAHADAELNTIVSVTQNIWDMESDTFLYAYIMPLDGTSATFDKTINTFGVKAAKNGLVRINGAAAHLDVYDMNGRLVYSIDNPAAEVATGLRSGLYIIKATGKDGNVVTTKASI